MSIPAVSVIVPVYNSQESLSKCIDSILAQTFSDFELILVNDGSNDASGDICVTYASKDSRIKVFHKDNGGVSSARNLGIEKAVGKWLAFVDSDDIVSDKYLFILVSQIVCDKQVSLCSYGIIGGHGKAKIWDNASLKGADFVKHIFEKGVVRFSAPWARIYNAGIVRRMNIRFPEGISMGEDAIFNLQYYCNIDILTISDEVGYFYFKSDKGSLVTKIYSYTVEREILELLKKHLTVLLNRYPELGDENFHAKEWYVLSAQFSRCLRSIYDNRNNLDYNSQISLLHSLDSSEVETYCKYYRPSTGKWRINAFLLKHKLYWAFIFFNKFYKNNQ